MTDVNRPNANAQLSSLLSLSDITIRNQGYETRDIPEEFAKNRIIALPQEGWKDYKPWNVVVIKLFPYHHLLQKYYWEL